ncbi:restriction endonuclease subunit S [Romboutsia sp. 1001216sp1]|uniref:restriction endonuclease subunit S n=1 Tax=Romboutsia sp. 1001216sp1 TaxID=2986997 RepID=UPI00232C02AB|nr:restriction endonuclease subunit S [Romboutsia sp. 1001216sp1]MDB8790426.1 restriction endonuclease subunit S [Romboutsia sp. 1001216sp1]
MNKTPKLRFKEFSGDWRKTILKKVTNGFEYGMNAASTEFDGENKYIRITDIDENTSKYINSNVVSPLGELEDKYLVKENDILFARTGASTGKTYLYDKNDGKLYFAGFLIRANVNSDNNAKFMFLQTKTKAYDKWVKVMSMRSGQPGINSQEYASYSFNAPSKEEQEKIASFFSLIDDKISLQGEKVEALKDYKKGMMQKIFSRELRFKDDDGRDYPDWKTVEMGDITVKVGPKNKENKNYEVYSINNKVGFIPQNEQFEDSRLDGLDKSLYKIINKGEFAYNPARINVGSIGVLEEDKTVIVSSLYVCFKFINNLNYRFFMQYFLYPQFNKDVIRNTEGTVREYLFYENFSNIKVNIPCLEEQNKIAKLLDSLDNKIRVEKNKVDSLNEYKKGLLQQMFV